jgi:nucleotide-binding universal stress UspA family protein
VTGNIDGADLAVDTVLVPVDGGDEGLTAAEYGVAVADRYDARVHALYVLGEGMVRAVETGAADDDAVADEIDAVLSTVAEVGQEADVSVSTASAYGFSTVRKTVHPGSVVLDAAEEVDADFVVLPNERDEHGDVLEKAASYVLQYASQPVLSV